MGEGAKTAEDPELADTFGVSATKVVEGLLPTGEPRCSGDGDGEASLEDNSREGVEDNSCKAGERKEKWLPVKTSDEPGSLISLRRGPVTSLREDKGAGSGFGQFGTADEACRSQSL